MRGLFLELFSASITIVSIAVVVMLEIQAVAALVMLDFLFCAYFWGEFLAGLRRAEDKRLFAISNAVLVLGAVPFVFELRWLRLFRLVRLLRIFRLGVLLFRAWNKWLCLMNVNPLATLATAALILILVGAAAFSAVELGTNPSINSYFDAVWFTIVTATTVGYGDVFPTTVAGRIVAFFVFVIGIGLVGSLTAVIAVNLLKQPKTAENPDFNFGEVIGRLERVEELLKSRKEE